MRRRRLIGVYRGLLMSIWMPWLRFDFDVRGGGAWRRDKKSLNMRRVHMGKLADRAAQHNRVKVVFVVRASARRIVAAVGCFDPCRPLCKAALVPSWIAYLNTIEARVGATCVPAKRIGTRSRRRERPAAPETA